MNWDEFKSSLCYLCFCWRWGRVLVSYIILIISQLFHKRICAPKVHCNEPAETFTNFFSLKLFPQKISIHSLIHSIQYIFCEYRNSWAEPHFWHPVWTMNHQGIHCSYLVVVFNQLVFFLKPFSGCDNINNSSNHSSFILGSWNSHNLAQSREDYWHCRIVEDADSADTRFELPDSFGGKKVITNILKIHE